MNWLRIIFSGNIKIHFVHKSVLDAVTYDIFTKYGVEPAEITEIESLCIDPGGMICTRNQPIILELDGDMIQVQPEHILRATSRWASKNSLSQKTDEGEEVIRVYMTDLFCVAVSKEMHSHIGGWLSTLSAEGHVARAEYIEKLKGSNIIVAPQPTDKPCGEA